MNMETLRPLIGNLILLALAAWAVAMILRKNWPRIREICTDEDGKWDVLGGLERWLKNEDMPDETAEPDENAPPDEAFMALVMRQKVVRMQDFDPEKEWIREHIIFRGRVQGVGFRYQAMVAARSFGLTGWVENLPDGAVEMEVQGTAAAIGKMIRHLGSGHWIRIDDMDAESIPVVPEERSFSVRGY